MVRTGTESRAELEFADLTLARLGSNSIFSFDAEARAMNFTQGAVLFSKPTNSGTIQLQFRRNLRRDHRLDRFYFYGPDGGNWQGRSMPSNGKGTTTHRGHAGGKDPGRIALDR